MAEKRQKNSKFVLSEVTPIDAPNFIMNPAYLNKNLGLDELTIKRVYWMNGVKGEKTSGQHAHKDNENEVFIVISGQATLIYDDEGTGKKEIPIKKNNIMWVPRLTWHGFTNLSDDFVVIALTTTDYDPERKGYVTDYEEFKKIKGSK